MHVSMYVYICTHVYTHIHTYMHIQKDSEWSGKVISYLQRRNQEEQNNYTFTHAIHLL